MEFDIFEAYAHLRGLKHVSRAKLVEVLAA
jgi:hypothetical protein